MTFTPEATAARGVALGRPWRPFSRVVVLNSRIDAGLAAAGFVDWRSTYSMADAFYAEAGSSGPGANPAARDSRFTRLTPAQMRSFEPAHYLRGADERNAEADAALLP